LAPLVAHDGIGEILARRVRDGCAPSAINFIDLVVVPAGRSIGLHRHAASDEEIYVIIAGSGCMTVDGDTVRVGAGDVIANPGGGTHGLVNDGAEALRLVVIDVAVAGALYADPTNLSQHRPAHADPSTTARSA